MQNESIPDPVGLEVLVGNWFAWFGYARGRGMMQLHLNDDGTFRFADFGRGEQSSGTYTVVRGELVLGNASKGTGRRWRILSIRPGCIILDIPGIGHPVDFQRDLLAQ